MPLTVPSKYIDITLSISNKLPVWPGSAPVRFYRNSDIEKGDIATDTTVQFGVHMGTHVDAPSHFIKEGKSVEHISLDILIGKSYVAEVPGSENSITVETLNKLDLPDSIERLLLKTKNSQLWRHQSFYSNFVALTADAAQWIVNRGIKLVGIDYLSIQGFYDGPEVHQILLSEEVVVVEGLNLNDVPIGWYELFCLPIKLRGVEGAPARVLLRAQF